MLARVQGGPRRLRGGACTGATGFAHSTRWRLHRRKGGERVCAVALARVQGGWANVAGCAWTRARTSAHGAWVDLHGCKGEGLLGGVFSEAFGGACAAGGEGEDEEGGDVGEGLDEVADCGLADVVLQDDL